MSRSRTSLVLASVAATLALAVVGCPRSAPAPVTPPPDTTASRVAIARAEARRADGVDALVRFADDAEPAVRAAALRGLGRTGTPAAVELLRARVAAGGADAAAAAEALGFAGALDAIDADAAPGVTAALVALAASADPAARAVAIEALGRAGDAGGLAAITAGLASPDAAAARAAGYAVGRLGRRGLRPDAAMLAAAAARADDPDRDVRHAATYALSRGVVAPGPGEAAVAAPDAVVAALVARVDDADGEIRALAIAGLARWRARGAAGAAVVARLRDPDSRVAVEAVRALAGADAPADDVAAVATHAAREWSRLAVGEAPPSVAHVVIEALGALEAHAGVVEVRAAVRTIVESLDEVPPAQRAAPLRLAASHVRVRALAVLARRAPDDPRSTGAPDTRARRALDDLDDVPPHVLGAELAALYASQLADDPSAATALIGYATDARPAIRGAALAELPAALDHLGAAAPSAVIDALVAGIADARADVAGPAADAAAAVLARLDATPAPAGLDHARTTLWAALLQRVHQPWDAELLISLVNALAASKVTISDGKDVCYATLADANAAVRAAGRACYAALAGREPPEVTIDPPPPLPDELDPADVIGRSLVWEVETSRGTLRIALDPAAAPWHVATIVALTRRGFYDGLTFHRVVPDFVVQGGDPDGTGWGGPGFTLPSEPSGRRYARGAVGIADAGKDTGGSQWFVTHAHAPHLEGRYTVIGEVVAGDDVIDALLVGDTIVRAAIVVE